MPKKKKRKPIPRKTIDRSIYWPSDGKLLGDFMKLCQIVDKSMNKRLLQLVASDVRKNRAKIDRPINVDKLKNK